MGLTGQILPTLLCLQYTTANLHQPKIRTPKGLGASDDIGLPRWSVQGGDLGGHFQAFVQHLKVQISRNFSAQLPGVHMSSATFNRNHLGSRASEPRVRRGRGSTGCPQKAQPSPS